jgi:hypothetical protein
MPKIVKIRVLAIVIFAAVSCYSAVNLFVYIEASKAHFSDISETEGKYRALKDRLPGRGMVGYDSPDTCGKEYFIAEYALCPLVLDRNGRHEYTIRVDGERVSVTGNGGAR